MSKIDENKVYVALASDGTTAKPLRVDPVTGRLLITMNKTVATSDGVKIKRDENKVPSSLAQDTNGVVKSLILDSTNKYLYIDNV